MTLADKIIEERRKLSLSQEELAERLGVSRQAVSKWEGAQSVPDLQRIVKMSELFSVSTDYLLKDESGSGERPMSEEDTKPPVRIVTMGEANEFLDEMKKSGGRVALGVALCILSPVVLIFLAGLLESESLASIIGLSVMFILIAIAVVLFIYNGARTADFNFLTETGFETQYGVSGYVREKKREYKPSYTLILTISIVLCVLSPLPLIIASLMELEAYLVTSALCIMLIVIAFAVSMIVRSGMLMRRYDILLREGDFDTANKEKNKLVEAVGGIYWSLFTALYLVLSFATGRWDMTWIVWPAAGVLCAPVMAIVKLKTNKEDADINRSHKPGSIGSK